MTDSSQNWAEYTNETHECQSNRETQACLITNLRSQCTTKSEKNLTRLKVYDQMSMKIDMAGRNQEVFLKIRFIADDDTLAGSTAELGCVLELFVGSGVVTIRGDEAVSGPEN